MVIQRAAIFILSIFSMECILSFMLSNTISMFQQMVGNGDVFNDQNERIIDGTIANTADSGAKTITHTLTINDVSNESVVMTIHIFDRI